MVVDHVHLWSVVPTDPIGVAVAAVELVRWLAGHTGLLDRGVHVLVHTLRATWSHRWVAPS